MGASPEGKTKGAPLQIHKQITAPCFGPVEMLQSRTVPVDGVYSKAQAVFPVRAGVGIFMTINDGKATQTVGEHITCGHKTDPMCIHPYPLRLAWIKV